MEWKRVDLRGIGGHQVAFMGVWDIFPVEGEIFFL